MLAKSDLELINDFRQGNIEGFNELVRRYQQKVYWIARRVLGSHDEADDVAQDVFVRVYEKLKDFRGDSSFYTWIYRIAFNLALNASYKKKVKDMLRFDDVSEIVSDQETADDVFFKKEYSESLDRAIAKLPKQQKAAFIMRYYDDLPYEEIAGIMNLSLGGVKANYSQALKKLKEFVSKEFES